MSGIYIPGLKDLSCDECFWGIGSRLGCHATPEAVTRKINGRAADCPLIFVGDHGRLGDLDELKERATKRLYASNHGSMAEAYFAALIDLIDTAPTIIPADKEAEK